MLSDRADGAEGSKYETNVELLNGEEDGIQLRYYIWT